LKVEFGGVRLHDFCFELGVGVLFLDPFVLDFIVSFMLLLRVQFPALNALLLPLLDQGLVQFV